MIRSRPRTGFTMLEMVLVMMIVVMIAAFAYPTFDSIVAYTRAVGAADAVKGAWAQARAKAIEEGRSYRFSVIDEGRWFRVAPDDANYWAGGNADPTDPDNPPLVLIGKIPKETAFGQKNAGPTTVSDKDDSKENEPTGSANWTTVAVFQADGTARDDVTITFHPAGTGPVTLQLRALTGTCKTYSGKDQPKD